MMAKAKRIRPEDLTPAQRKKYEKAMADIDQVRAEIEKEMPEVRERFKAWMKQRDRTVKLIGQQLRQIREAQEFSLSDLAERTGVGKSAISKIELGENANPTIGTLIRIADGLGGTLTVTVDQ